MMTMEGCRRLRWGIPAVVFAFTCLGLSCACSASGKNRPNETPPTDMPDRGARPAVTDPSGPETREYRAGLRHLQNQEWKQATESFRIFQSEHPQHDKAAFAELYIARAHLGRLPPWGSDGVNGGARGETSPTIEPDSQSRAVSMLTSLAAGERRAVIRQAARLYLVYALNRAANANEETERLVEQIRALKQPVIDAAVRPSDRAAVLSGVLYAASNLPSDKTDAQHSRRLVSLADRLFSTVVDDGTDDKLTAPATGAGAKSGGSGAGEGDQSKHDAEASSPQPGISEKAFKLPASETDRMLVAFSRQVAFAAAQRVQYPKDWSWPTEAEKENVYGTLALAAFGWGRCRQALSDGDSSIESLQSLLDNTTRALHRVGATDRATELAVYRATAGDSGPMVLAAVVPWSGPNASIGKRAVDGMMLALDVFEGRQVSRVTVEVVDATKPPAHIQSRLTQIDASMVLGPLDQKRARTLAPVVRKLDIPMMPMTTQPVGVENVGNPEESSTILRNFLDPVAEAKVAARAAFKRRDNRSVAILYPDNGYGRTMRDTFKKEFQELGGRIPLEESYSRKTSDYSAPASALANSSADGVFIPGSASNVAELSAFIAQENVWGKAPERDVKGQRGGKRIDYIGTSLWVDPVLPSQAASYLGEPVIPVWYAPGLDDDASRRFTRRFQRAFDRRPKNVEAFAYDSIDWIRQFVIRRGIRRPASLMRSMTSGVTLRGATGAVQFSQDEQTRSVRFVTLSKTGFRSMGFEIDVTVASVRAREQRAEGNDQSAMPRKMTDDSAGEDATDDTEPDDQANGNE